MENEQALAHCEKVGYKFAFAQTTISTRNIFVLNI